MYQALLTRRYLTSKIMPLLAALAVALCTAMVLTVWSVMGGFLAMLLSSGRTLMGDVTISWPVAGFGHYAELIETLKQSPKVAEATPVVESPALLGTPVGDTALINAVGIEPSSYDKVTGYADSVWWKPLETPLPKDKGWDDPRLWNPPPSTDRGQTTLATADQRESMKRGLERLQRAAMDLGAVDPRTGDDVPGAVLGIELGRLNQRRLGGWYEPRHVTFGKDSVTLSVLPVSAKGVAIDVQARRFPVVNNFKTGLYDIDARTVLVRLSSLQEMLGMQGATRVDPATAGAAPGFGVVTGPDGRESFAMPKEVASDPARVTSVLVRTAGGVSAADLKRECENAYLAFASRHPGEAAVPSPSRILILTWDERPAVATLVQAVRKETALVLFIFGFISLTAVFLVFAIFWAMVSEKTKDVGVLRAVGASRSGIAWLFLRYGVAIGVVGAALGGGLAYAVVLNINPIHDWLGTALGITVWDPSVYYFTRIPSRVEPDRAALVLCAGVLCAAGGALIPALKAALMDPVRALRFE